MNNEAGVNDDMNIDMTGNPWAQAGWHVEEWPQPWMLTTGPYICGHGSLIFAILTLQEEDDKYRNRRFMAFNGGFHTVLETHKMCGKMFGPTHLQEIWQLWWASTAQQDWVLSPGNHNQVEDEMKMYYPGMICAAVCALLAKRREESDNGADIDGITDIDVFNFLTDTANPMAQVVLTEMRYAEVIFLLHQAEDESNAEKYVTGLKLAATLYTANRATKYAKTCAKFFSCGGIVHLKQTRLSMKS